ncbi:CotH kinase family protein [Ancylomarina longa]|nr:CotH kinase family protein [Ancylomarina longa]
MRFTLLIVLCCLTLPLTGFSQSPKGQEKKKAGERIFVDGIVHEIQINFLQCNAWDSLLMVKKMRDSLEIRRYLQGNVVVDGKHYYSCGVRMKGESSFDFYPGKKKSFKINFGKYVKKQRVDGLKTLNLNNAFRDPTYMREKIYLDFLREEGLPAPRCSYANVYLNGEHLGFYVLTEEINKGFLKRNFGNKDGAFFKGEPRATLKYLGENSLKYQEDYRNKSNLENPYPDLKDLIRTINQYSIDDGGKFSELDSIFNVEACLKIYAVTSLFMNVDAYNLLYPHNYYLYSNSSTKKLEWIPYDGNYAFCAFSKKFTLAEAQDLSVFYLYNGEEMPLVRYLLGFEKYRTFYSNYITHLLENKFTENQLVDRIDKLSIKIRKYVYQDNNKMYSNADFEQNLHSTIGDEEDPGAFIPGLKSFVHHRIKAVKKELKMNTEERN